MSSTPPEICDEAPAQQLGREGFALLRGAYCAEAVAGLRESLTEALRSSANDSAVRGEAEAVYAARNVLELWPAADEAWRTPQLIAFLRQILGPFCGLVRVLYFDKPPEKSWALPFHKDIHIAAIPPLTQSPRYSPMRMKAGVPHVEPPVEVLESMLTLRIHLDDATPENGPLEVIPGSHASGKQEPPAAQPAVTVYAAAGDVLAMRPLILHASSHSTPGTARHRRILHLEFAAQRDLPDGYFWRWFFAV